MDTGRTCDCVWGVCHDDCGLFTTNCAVPLLVPIYCISSGILDIRQRNLGAFGSGVRNVGKSFSAAAIQRASERSVGGRFGD